ncbi:hypothetical protein J0H58_36800 [bacterium]|nr:hypothetical protein [bacterium]
MRRRLACEVLEDRATPATFTGTAITDTGTGTGTSGDLRYCVTQANATAEPDDIVFGVTGTVTLGGTQLTLSDDVTIAGGGTVTIDANGASRVFEVEGGATVSLSGLTVTGGSVGAASSGGAILLTLGTLTVTDCTLTGNSADAGGGGAIMNSFANTGTLTVTGSSFTGNSAVIGGTIRGGNVTVAGSSFTGNSTQSGGALSIFSSTVTDSTFAENGATIQGGAIFCEAFGPLTVTRSTFTDNTSGGGGAIAAGELTVVASMFSGNTARIGGGILAAGGSSTTVTDSTFAGNSATDPGFRGGAIYIDAVVSTAELTMTGTILADSPSGGDLVLANGATASGSFNLVEDGTGVGTCFTNSRSGDPALLPLADNGGPTQTMGLRPGSIALDAGTGTNPDQRGRVPAGTRDIGAFERQGSLVAVVNDLADTNARDGVLTLREAVALANGELAIGDLTPEEGAQVTGDAGAGGAISFSVGGTVTLGGTQLTLATDTTIAGGGAVTVSGNNASRVFEVEAGVTAALSGLTVTNGLWVGSGSTGGGVLNHGSLTVTGCTFTANSTTLGGSGGAIGSTGTLAVSDSVFSGNSATVGLGGAIRSDGTLTVTDSTFTGNTAGAAGAIDTSGATGPMTLTGSTFVGNVGTAALSAAGAGRAGGASRWR